MIRPISSENSIAESAASSVHFDESSTETMETWLGKRGQKNKLKSLQRKTDEKMQKCCFAKCLTKQVQRHIRGDEARW